MEEFHDPKGIRFKIQEETGKYPGDLYDTMPDGLFSTGQIYEDEPADTAFCINCEGKQFYVGISRHWTGIKCVNCDWEACVHQG